jgi:hypothetical protein
VDERAIPRRALNRLAFYRQRARTHICLRRWFSRFGERSAIYGTVRVRVDGAATVGDHLVIEGYDAKVSIKVAPGATLTVADDACLAAGAPARVIRKLELPDGWVRR